LADSPRRIVALALIAFAAGMVALIVVALLAGSVA
jgi:hypothetical protein